MATISAIISIQLGYLLVEMERIVIRKVDSHNESPWIVKNHEAIIVIVYFA